MADDWSAFNPQPASGKADPWAAFNPGPISAEPQQQQEPEQAPEAFLHRLSAGLAVGWGRGKELAGEGVSQMGTGLQQISSEQHPPPEALPDWLNRAIDARPELAAQNERSWQIAKGFGNYFQGMLQTGFGIPEGVAGALGEEFAGRDEAGNLNLPHEVTENAIGLIGPGLLGLPAKFMRMRNGVPQVIGELPKPQDFKTSADAITLPKQSDPSLVEQNLRDLWKERGIHPAEAVHDAQSDALLKQQIAPPSIVAYHGSPYSFDAFDIGKIGTGEGAQSYGHGLYFAGNPAVAGTYKTSSGIGSALTVGGEPFNSLNPTHVAAELIHNTGSRENALQQARKQIALSRSLVGDNTTDAMDAVIGAEKLLQGESNIPEYKSGNMYQVRIHADPEHFLDWDKPLNEQSEHVQKSVKPLLAQARANREAFKKKIEAGEAFGTLSEGAIRGESRADIDGQTVHQILARDLNGYEGASKALHEADIPGIKYLDQGSRTPGLNFEVLNAGNEYHLLKGTAAGSDKVIGRFPSYEEANAARDAELAKLPEPTSNFVVFDHDDVEITHKNGVPLTKTETAPVRGTPMPEGTPRSELARTGEAHIDNILESPVTQRAIDNAVVDRQYTVPYTAGGSTPLEDPTMFIDHRFPQSFTVDGVTFDPAEPFAIHENVEQHVMELLIKGGMSDQEAYRVAHFEFAEKAEGAWYRSHGIDQEKAEAAYAPYMADIQKAPDGNPPPNLYVKPYPHDNPSAAQAEPIAEPKPSKEEVAQAKAILAAQEPREGIGGAPVGAAITPPGNLPSLAAQPPRPAGSLVAKGQAAVDQALGLAKNVQGLLDPMATGSKEAMVIAKDAMNSVRRIRWEHAQIDNELMNSPQLKAARDRTGETIWQQHERMWNAADEESVMQQQGTPSPHMGLATLEPEERTYIDMLHQRAQAAWLHAVDADMVEGEGLPAYTPRMVMNVSALTDAVGPQVLNELGRNVFTRTAQMLHREHLTAEETETAAKALVEKRMTAAGATPAEIAEAVAKVQIARTIRGLPLATARLEEAVIWRQMIKSIEDVGKAAGQPAVAYGHQPPGWFTIAGSPAFSRWRPALEQDPISGKWITRTDDTGRILMERQPIYLPNEFRGPMRAILDPGNALLDPSKPGPYGILMALKGKAMTAILNSPLIHNEVVWSKVAEAAGGREWMGFGLYWRGNRIVNGWQQTGRATELIERGLAPIGPRGPVQDITGMMEEPNMAPGRSLTAKVARFIPDLFDPARPGQTVGGVGDKVAAAIDKAGDFVHNTLLWDRVRDLQFGLADHLSDRLVAKGVDRLTADRFASHFSNIVVGSIPKEAMSGGARATANIMLFSRSFTLGNLATFKQAIAGIPAPILAQIERDLGVAGKTPDEIEKLQKSAQWMARKKAISTIAISAGLYYVGNAVIQHAFDMIHGSSVEDEVEGYARRYRDAMNEISKNPFELRNLIARLSPTYDNEPAKQDRAFVGHAADGTGIYARNPTGKYGEEMVGYPTMPLSMLKRKLSPLAGGLADLYQNDEFGGAFDTKRPIYDPNANDFQIGIAVAKHLVEKHLPMGQIKGAADLLSGEGDQTVNALRLLAPALGFTVSEGAPGGPQKGEFYAAKSAADMKFNMAWPDIKKQIQGGDVDGGRKLLEQLGKSPLEIRGLIRAAVNPAAPVHGRTLQNFLRYATPEQRERFERAQQRPQP